MVRCGQPGQPGQQPFSHLDGSQEKPLEAKKRHYTITLITNIMIKTKPLL